MHKVVRWRAKAALTLGLFAALVGGFGLGVRFASDIDLVGADISVFLALALGILAGLIWPSELE